LRLLRRTWFLRRETRFLVEVTDITDCLPLFTACVRVTCNPRTIAFAAELDVAFAIYDMLAYMEVACIRVPSSVFRTPLGALIRKLLWAGCCHGG
jgi:hypothetical protein